MQRGRSQHAVETGQEPRYVRVHAASLRHHDARRMPTGKAPGHARRACGRMGGFGRTPPPRDDRIANPASDGSGLAAPSSTTRPKRRQTRSPNARIALVAGGYLIDPAAPEVVALIEEVVESGSGGIGHGLSLVGRAGAGASYAARSCLAPGAGVSPGRVRRSLGTGARAQPHSPGSRRTQERHGTGSRARGLLRLVHLGTDVDAGGVLSDPRIAGNASHRERSTLHDRQRSGDLRRAGRPRPRCALDRRSRPHRRVLAVPARRARRPLRP
jgi:hypothetical protein